MTKKQIRKISVYTLILIFLIIYSKVSYPHVTLDMCLKEPDKYDNYSIFIINEITVSKITDNGFLINHEGSDYTVIGALENVKDNDYLTIRAIFHKEGWLELQQGHVVKNRRLKVYLSAIPVLIIVSLFMLIYRFNFRYFRFEERKNA